MTEKQYNYLSQYEKHFYTAVNSGWCSAISKPKRRVLFKMYEDLIPNAKPQSPNCFGCLKTVMKELGKLWYSYKPEKPKAKKQNKAVLSEEIPEDIERPDDDPFFLNNPL